MSAADERAAFAAAVAVLQAADYSGDALASAEVQSAGALVASSPCVHFPDVVAQHPALPAALCAVLRARGGGGNAHGDLLLSALRALEALLRVAEPSSSAADALLAELLRDGALADVSALLQAPRAHALATASGAARARARHVRAAAARRRRRGGVAVSAAA